MTDLDTCLKTPLYDLHVELGGRMVPFAGYAMPVQYPLGIMKEHLHTREAAGLFDVSHMGQALLKSTDGSDPAEALETLVPGNITGLAPGRMRYTLLLNDEGGIRDDLMVTRISDDTLYLVVNAACKDADFAHISEQLARRAALEIMEDKALIALQGPCAELALSELAPAAADLAFMQGAAMEVDGIGCQVSRSGYTGEDGYEISVPVANAEALARTLLASEHVEAIGLGARDSLRLEAGLCLYGHDIDETTSPIEGNLKWAVPKRRREEGGFPGVDRVLGELANGTSRVRVGIRPDGRAPARQGTEVADTDGNIVGAITSGGFGPSVGGPVAMGYVPPALSEPGTEISLMVRGKALPAHVAELPFVTKSYVRKK